MGKLEDIYINKTREYLKREAQRIIEKAQMEKTTGNETNAQMDSYGALIFYNGGLVYTLIPTHKDLARQSFGISASSAKSYIDENGNLHDYRHKGWKDIPAGHGWDWAKLLRAEIKSGAWGEIPKRGFCLVIFNAAFYSAVHEKQEKYKILSMVVSDLKNLEAKFKKQGATLRGHRLKGLQ